MMMGECMDTLAYRREGEVGWLRIQGRDRLNAQAEAIWSAGFMHPAGRRCARVPSRDGATTGHVRRLAAWPLGRQFNLATPDRRARRMSTNSGSTAGRTFDGNVVHRPWGQRS